MLAECLLAHLEAELSKSPALLNKPTREGKLQGEATRELKAVVCQNFPDAKPVDYNLFEEWVKRRELAIAYSDGTFLLYSRTFFWRILDLAQGTDESRALLREKIRHLLRTGKFRGQDFTFRIFFHAEHVMLDLMRERLLAGPHIPFQEAWELLKEQSEFWSECGYDYYDSVLGAALARLQAQKEDAEERANRAEREIRTASEIQMSILPAELPQIEGGSIRAIYKPAALVGGDFYDVVRLSETELGVLIADVTGHGVPAALVASMLKVSFAHQKEKLRSPSRVLQQIDVDLFMPTGLLISAAYVHVDFASKRVTAANAGHPPVLVRRRQTGACFELAAHGTLLGWREDHPAPQETMCDLLSGDRLLLYTDGLTEAANAEGDLFDFERLASAFAAADSLETQAALASLLGGVEAFRGRERPLQDDATALLIDMN